MTNATKNTMLERFRRRVVLHLRQNFVGGVLLLTPLVLTYIIIRFLVDTIDGLLQPAIREVFNREVTGLGAVALLVTVYLAGLSGGHFTGRRVVQMGQAALMRIPIINAVYSPARQLIESFSGADRTAFKEVVVIEYPRKDAWMVGFLTGSTIDGQGNPLSIVYLPTAPMPNSGWMAILPQRDVYPADMTVPEAMRLVLSGGIICPPEIRFDRAVGPASD
ncbi:MAG: DUF502 domain-containing protein [Chloroflexi bacterium]|nr:DUF502 domain-containing protein [Chloroflexota bacterium]